jgi:hypothetical protein
MVSVIANIYNKKLKELITRPESPTDCGASLCEIKKPRGREGHSPRWAAEQEKKKLVDRVICYL